MNPDKLKETPEILELIKKAQAGHSASENKLVLIYAPYVNYMVRRYSKKTEIKENDDLRSYINEGLLEGIRRYDSKVGIKFILFARIWMKKCIFMGETSFKFIRIPVNQKIFYEAHRKELYSEESLEMRKDTEDSQRFLLLENTKTEFFSDLHTYDEDSGVQELPEYLLRQTNINKFNESEDALSIDVLRSNIQQVLKNFNEKEVYIIEHLFGLNGAELLSSEEIAANLKVTKVNITFTKTRIIRMLRHSSMSNKILNGI